MEIWWDLLECEVVVFVAMGAAHLVEVLPCLLLWGERGRMPAGNELQVQCDEDSAYPPFRKKRERMGHPESAA